MLPITPQSNNIPRTIKAIAETMPMIWGFMIRAISCDPIMISMNEQQIRAVADPRATHRTYSGFSLARSNVVICVLSPISDKKITPSTEKKRRHSTFCNRFPVNNPASLEYLQISLK